MLGLTNAFQRGIKPNPLMTYAEWAGKYFNLAPGSEVPGLINFAFAPYLIEPLINFSWVSPVKQEFFMKGVQIAASTLYDIILCAMVDYCPCPAIVYFGSDTMAQEYSKLRFTPCADNIDKLRGKLSDGNDSKGKSTQCLKIFPGGYIKFTGGITEKAYRSISAAIVLMDDIDAFPRDIDGTEKRKGQGSPIDLARARTNARMGKYKIGVSGSPTDTETSLIYSSFKSTDQRYYYVPCPYCSTLQIIDFWRIRFKKNAQDSITQTPKLECISCNKLISEDSKHEIMQLENGAKWQATKETDDPLTVGRHLSSAYSLIGYSWLDMAKEFIKASRENKKGNSRLLRTFYNTKLGIPWDRDKEQKTINHTELYKSREEWKFVPADGIIITAGVDVQTNRIEVLVTARGEKGDVYCLECKIIGGNTLIEYQLDGSPFNDLENYLKKTFVNVHGIEQPIWHTCIDLGFRSIIVSPFLSAVTRNGLDITGVFGSSSKTKRKLFVGQPIKNKYDVLQRELNVDEGKTLNHYKLKNGLIHFSKHPSFTEDFFRQFTVETWSDKYQSWICPDHARNEAIDTLNYSGAAFDIYSNSGNIDWEDFKKWNRTGGLVSTEETYVISEGIVL